MTRLVGAAFIVAVVLFVMWLLAGPVKVKAEERQRFCGESKFIVDLITSYGDEFKASEDFEGASVQLFMNDATGTWALVAVVANRACIIDVGRDRRART